MIDNAYTQLIDIEKLLPNLDHPDWVIVDCRFDLTNPEWGFADYQRAHIPGAVYADLDHDLAGPRTATSGRHPLPTPEAFCTTMGRLGIGHPKQVVVYDTTGGSFAARLWWLLKLYGHASVAVLNGGFAAWTGQGLPTETGVHHNAPAYFHGQPNLRMVVSTEEMEKIVSAGQGKIIDARAPERYRGDVEPIDPIPGHIPGAINRFHQDNLDSHGYFLPGKILAAQFKALVGETPTREEIVAYCGSGVTSCHNLLAMSVAGLPMPRLYVGSWSEWIRDPSRPVARGENPG